MSGRYCKSCGDKIPRKVPHSNKKTSQTRKNCYNCSPPFSSDKHKYEPEHKSERRRRKEILVKMLGGKCVQCGYNKSLPALSFHHLDTAAKKFDISNGGLMREWDEVVREAKKCELLCLNCHAELHST
jgi:hypothetical protein